MIDYAPIARIVLRYAVGAGVMGSEAIGNQLAADPDIVVAASLAIGIGVEAFYGLAKRRGWAS